MKDCGRYKFSGKMDERIGKKRETVFLMKKLDSGSNEIARRKILQLKHLQFLISSHSWHYHKVLEYSVDGKHQSVVYFDRLG